MIAEIRRQINRRPGPPAASRFWGRPTLDPEIQEQQA